MFKDSVIEDEPQRSISSVDVAELEDNYDMPYAKFKSVMAEIMVPGDQVEEECAKTFVPNPDPETLQYFA